MQPRIFWRFQRFFLICILYSLLLDKKLKIVKIYYKNNDHACIINAYSNHACPNMNTYKRMHDEVNDWSNSRINVTKVQIKTND